MVENGKLRQAQLCELDLLKTLRSICEAEGIKYYLLGGTAIGAVRHKGFIPWDDDIDVGMLRDDYERFLAVAPGYLKEDQILKHFSLDASYGDYTMKLVNSRIVFVTQQQNAVQKKNIWIDIFPLDGSPDNKLLRWIHFRKIDYRRMLLAFYSIKNIRIDSNRATWKKVLVSFATYVPVGKLVDPVKQKRAIDKEFKKYSIQSCKQIGNYMGAYHEIEFFPQEYFAEGTEVTFEGETFRAPKELSKYLTHQYGDYMSLPPVEKQFPKHYVLDVIDMEN